MNKIELEILAKIETRAITYAYDNETENEYLIPDIQMLCQLMTKYWADKEAYARIVEVDVKFNRYLTKMADID